METSNKFGGFDSIVNSILPNQDEDKLTVDPEDIEKEMEKLDGEDSKSEEPEDKEDKKENKSSEEIDPSKRLGEEHEDDTKDDNEEDKEGSKLNPEDLEESDIVDVFSDLFAEELGWEYGEDEKPKSIKELVNYMQNIIETNSTPKYSNDQVRELDEFVRNGGKVRDYYATSFSTEIDLDKVDLTKESVQKAVIKENLKNRGYSEARIDKLITRYEDTATLEDEAKDSYEEVKEFREKSKAELLSNQQKVKAEEENAERQFISNVEKIISDSTDIRGIELSSKEKRELFDYIFKPDRDGATKYQKDYNSNLKNLVESAYFTMKGDKFVQQIQNKAKTSAAKDLITKLKTKGKSTKNTVSEQDDNNRKVTQLWEIASKELKTF